MNATFWDVGAVTVTPRGHGKNYAAQLEGPGGQRLGSVEDGTLRDASGTVVLEAPVRWEKSGKRFSLDFRGADGAALGRAKPVKTSVGPRVTKATVAVAAPDGAEVLEPNPTGRASG